MIEASRPTAVDFFCGAGGLSEGLTKAGFEVLLASDFWAPAAQTYRQNHPSVPFLEDDIRDISVDTVIEHCGGRIPDVVAGGPPCQGFSLRLEPGSWTTTEIRWLVTIRTGTFTRLHSA